MENNIVAAISETDMLKVDITEAVISEGAIPYLSVLIKNF